MTDLWGGRFAQDPDERLRRFTSSLPVDRRLARYDIAGSKAHAAALRDAGVLSPEEYDTVVGGFTRIESEVDQGEFPPRDSTPLPEDVHSVLESRLVSICGEVGYKVHAGRSRNDQVVTAVLLWLKDAGREVELALREVQRSLIAKAHEYRDLEVYAYTHLQRAQPILLGHHLHAHYEALERDIGRLRDAARRADRSPLGACACAGTSIPLDRAETARRLGFATVAGNSIDAVSDRDWAVELVSACALAMVHLSRLAEDLVIWSSQEFAQARTADAWTTGSSALPQKRNPDIAELVRGRAARVMGDLVGLLAVMKGLPLAYNRDLQEDKEPLFNAVDTTRESALALAGVVAHTEFRAPRETVPDFATAVDLAEELVRRGVPFRQAHRRVGTLVQKLERDGRGLTETTDEELAQIGVDHTVRSLLTTRGSIEAKRTSGSTAPGEVAKALEEARAALEQERPITFGS